MARVYKGFSIAFRAAFLLHRRGRVWQLIKSRFPPSNELFVHVGIEQWPFGKESTFRGIVSRVSTCPSSAEGSRQDRLKGGPQVGQLSYAHQGRTRIDTRAPSRPLQGP